MMLDTWDGQIWYPRFYDIDTILSYDNSGAIKFDVDIEMEQGYWNTSASRLWTKIRDYMHDELVEVYKDMRANGVTYENIMRYMYDEQIAKIPQTYYNKDFDIKYAPYADEYLGKAHGDGYQHMKRWLKNRFIFCDTLFDYAPSYENDKLTIRANTLDLMSLEIETYTPVYQHISFYNGQMSKEKVDGKTSTIFEGTAQTATDQEVLIYGGSNIKKISGISSMNPDSMLIGNATRLTELIATDCPLLTEINSDKANLLPNVYLNKVDLSGCPLLGGMLKISNSQLLQNLNIKGTAITGVQLPSSIRNLEVLRLPNTLNSLTLNDAPLLHTLEFDNGINLQSISLKNCNKLDNCINFDLTQTPTVVLDNSYNTEELYMSATTNLTLKNMSSLKRVIFTPNSEYSAFDINNVINGANYKITTFNNPKMTDFITTAPHRLSYNGEDVGYKEKITEIIRTEEKTIECVLTQGKNIDRTDTLIDNADACYSEDYYEVISGQTYTVSSNGRWCGVLGYDKDKNFIREIREGISVSHDGGLFTVPDGIAYIRVSAFTCTSIQLIGTFNVIITEIIQVKDYGDITPNTVFTANTLDLSDTQFQNVKFLCTTDVYNLKVPTTMKNFYCDSAFDIDTDVIADGEYAVVHNELIEPYTTNYEGEVTRREEGYFENVAITKWNENTSIHNTSGNLQTNTSYKTSDFIEVVGGTYITHISNVDSVYQYTESYGLCYYSGASRTLESHTKYIKVVAPMSATDVKISYTGVNYRTPNIIPSSANGSLIFNMYSNNTTQPTSTSPYMWDLTGLKLEDFYTYGMNNWVKASDDSYERRVTSVKKISRWSVGGDLGGSSAGSVDYIALTPMIFKEGVTTVNFKSDKKICISVQWNDTTRSGQSTWATEVGIAFNNDQIKYRNVHLFFMDGEGSYIEITTNLGESYRIIMSELEDIRTDTLTSEEIYAMSSLIEGAKVLTEVKSITMPQRLPGYSVRLVNADITPDEYPTMLYPKLIDVTLPITGKLDYTKYNGTSLAWAYAYTTDDVSINPLGSREQVNITNDYNKLYSTDFVDIVDVWIYKDTDVSKLSTNEAITKAYIELTSSNYTTRVSEVLTYYPNCTDVYLFEDGSVTSLNDMFNTNNTIYRNQIVNVTFIDGYFDLLTNLKNGFREMKFLKKVNNIPNSVTNMAGCFLSAYELEYVSNLPSNLETADNIFTNCSVMTSFPSFPNNGRIKNLTGAFQSCKALTQAPAIPDSVTNMATTFYECTSLITAPNIPNSVTNMVATFQGCTSLTQAPVIPEGVTNMNSCFTWCTSLIKAPNIPNTCTDIKELCLQCTSMEGDFTFPLDTVTGSHNNCLGGTKISNIIWTGERATDLSLVSINCPNYTQEDIQELVPEHLADVTTNIYTIKNRIANINGLEIDLNSHQAYHVGNLIIGTNGSWGGYPYAGCGLFKKAILNGVEIIPILDTSGNPCFLNTSNGSLYYDSMGGTMTAGNVIGTYDGYSRLNYIKAENCYVEAEDIEIDINTHDLEYHLLVDGNQSAMDRHCVNFLASYGSAIRFYHPSGWFNNTSSNFRTGSATLTLGETYGAYLTPDEVFSANAKGWTIVGASNDFTIVNASVDASTLTTDESVLSCFIELTNDNYKTRIDEVLQWYPNCTDLYLFEDGSVTTLNSMFGTSGTSENCTYKAQIVTITFVDGYFQNTTNAGNLARRMPSLTTVNNIPNGVVTGGYMFEGSSKLTTITNLPNTLETMELAFSRCTSLVTIPNTPSSLRYSKQMFEGCSSFNQQLDWSKLNLTDNNALNSTFNGCSSLVYAPILPSNYTGSMANCFKNCTSLTEAPVIPDGVTNMSSTFQGCTALTQAPDIPQGVTIMQGTFSDCTALTQAPDIPQGVTNMYGCFQSCSALTTPPIIPEGVASMYYTFAFSGITTPPNIPSTATTIEGVCRQCTSLTTMTIPFRSTITNYWMCIHNSPITDITWEGEVESSLDISRLDSVYQRTQADIQELVPEHLGDLYKDKAIFDFSKKEITINNTKTTLE